MASKIEDYGLIGNLRTAALVSNAGSIDWFCAPRFDSDACFASLLGYDEHGFWSLRPTQVVRKMQQKYRGDTLILENEITCDGGSIRLIDFMPMNGDRCDLVRIVEGLEGEVPMEMLLNVRFGYGVNSPWTTPIVDGFQFVAGPDAVSLRTAVKLERSNRGVSAYFGVKKGDRVTFQYNWHPSNLELPLPLNVEVELQETEKEWSDWSDRCQYNGRWREAVLRSLITLRALTYEPTGAIVAAPTTSLPECLGGVRNWDYRFCWLRDTSLSIRALMIGGYENEAIRFRDWFARAVAGAPDEMQIMYDIDGGRRLTEFNLKELPGYEGSSPVHIGNAASEQFQLDIFGEVLNAAYLARESGIPPKPEMLVLCEEVANHVANVWQHPDDGVWEVRGGRRHFTYSKVMAWVAIDRAILLLEGYVDKDLAQLRSLRERMHEEICQRAFHPGVGAFTQSYGSDVLDASVLRITDVGFLPATDPRVASTVKAIERTLLRDGFVLRYDTTVSADGLPGTEGAFLACSFWLANNYAHLGRQDEAERLFERLLSLRNPLGLLSEEYDPTRGRLISNFPQGFSHLALVTSAHFIDSQSKKKAAKKAA